MRLTEVSSPKSRNFAQSKKWHRDIRVAMTDKTHALKVEKDSAGGLLVTFSDGTTAGYVVEELLSLGPAREGVEGTPESGWPTTAE